MDTMMKNHMFTIMPFQTNYIAMMNLPWLFDFGCYLNWKEVLEDGLPDDDFDLIFYDNGKGGLENNITMTILFLDWEKNILNAKIIGWIKEVNVRNEIRSQNRVKFLNECDAIVTSGISEQFKNIDMFKYLRTVVDKKWYFLSPTIKYKLFI